MSETVVHGRAKTTDSLLHGGKTVATVENETQGTPGGGGEGVVTIPLVTFEWVQIVPQATWTITHNLGYDPVAILVLDEFNTMIDEWGMTYLVPGVSLQIGHDTAHSGRAMLR